MAAGFAVSAGSCEEQAPSLLSRSGLGALLLTVGSLIASSVSTPAVADHIYDTCRDRGYVWFAAYNDFAIADITSSNSNQRELDAYNRVDASTVDELPVRWPSGIRLRRSYTHDCGETVTAYVDIKFSYEPASNFGNVDRSIIYGGYNVSFKASRSWCDTWSLIVQAMRS